MSCTLAFETHRIFPSAAVHVPHQAGTFDMEHFRIPKDCLSLSIHRI